MRAFHRRTTLIAFAVSGSLACGADVKPCNDGVQPSEGEDASRVTCGTDGDCVSGFCDSTGWCYEVDENSRFGTPCTVPPRAADGFVDGILDTCGAYMCTDARCRSCTSDTECQINFGAPSCSSEEELLRLDPNRLGRQCGNYSD